MLSLNLTPIFFPIFHHSFEFHKKKNPRSNNYKKSKLFITLRSAPINFYRFQRNDDPAAECARQTLIKCFRTSVRSSFRTSRNLFWFSATLSPPPPPPPRQQMCNWFCVVFTRFDNNEGGSFCRWCIFLLIDVSAYHPDVFLRNPNFFLNFNK